MDCQCQCGLTQFHVPFDEPVAYIVCHCDKCKIITGSAFHIAAIFPYFEIPETTRANLTSLAQPSESGNQHLGLFCKGCGNRMVHEGVGDAAKSFITCSAVRTKGVDIKAVLSDRKTLHFWTSKSAVPKVFWEASEAVFDEQPDEQAQKEFAMKLMEARKT